MSERQIDPGHFSQDAEDLLRLLHSHAVRFLLIGGEAVIFHGYSRFTGDLAIFYARDGANCEALFAALTAFWGGPVPGVESAGELEEVDMVFQFGRPPNRVDLLSTVAGIEFAKAWARREEATLGDVRVAFLGLRDLIRSKRAAGRHKDKEDLRYLKRVLKNRLQSKPRVDP